MQCPKCHANMRTFDRMGVHIEQCDGCRGVFLDYGELEAITRLEAQMQAPPPPPPAAPAPAQVHYVQPVQPVQPGWGAQPHYGHGYGHRKHHGLAGLFFSS
ncbi:MULTISPECIES: TFIIB-type zinc ribbon-containing protein [unclassified Saccharothrix]|uniref:TFIIB-type zinc ribbon-containing protein n=1 Tax=unclassified Saccharothrix TaxID=2593673 RepID=UPI00307E8F88